MPDIEKLRRFSLMVALALIFYTASGISLDAGAKASALGIPFIINNPDLLLVCFLLASIYGFIRSIITPSCCVVVHIEIEKAF